MSVTCPNCGHEIEVGGDPVTVIPDEPPIGTWVKDKYGSASLRAPNGNWGPGPGFYFLAQWRPMWEARGPLVPCGPYGRDLP